jgi:flagellar motor switch protein FliN/FliY
MLAGRDVTCTPHEPLKIAQEEVPGHFGERVLAFRFLCDGLDRAPMAVVLSERTGLILADLMMGGDGRELPAEANDLYLSASQEGLSQIIGAALTNLSGLLGGKRLMPADAKATLEEEGWLPFPDEDGSSKILCLKVDMDIEQVDKVSMCFVLREQEALLLEEEITAKMAAAAEPKAQAPAAGPSPQPRPAAAPSVAPQPQVQSSRPEPQPIDVRPAEFAPLSQAETAPVPANIDLILDIPVSVTVELGRTSRTIGEVLGLGPGSVIELEKMAGEPVDVLVNGKLVAHGEVVVIDESFGVRISEIVSKAERIRSIGR